MSSAPPEAEVNKRQRNMSTNGIHICTHKSEGMLFMWYSIVDLPDTFILSVL